MVCKNSTRMKRIVIGSVLLICTVTLAWSQRITPTTQNTTLIILDNSPDIEYKYHDGRVVLIDGTTLTGRFQYNGRKVFTYRATSQASRQRIALSMIKRLALVGSDTVVTNRTDSTVFTQLGHRLYRQLTDGLTVVLDRRFLVDEQRGKIGYKLYVLDSDGALRKFTSLQKLNKWFYAYQERSGKRLPDIYRNESEIVKAVAQLNDD